MMLHMISTYQNRKPISARESNDAYLRYDGRLQIKGVNERTVWAARGKNEKLLLVQERDPYCTLMTMKRAIKQLS